MPSYLTVPEQRLNFSITLFMRFRRLAKPVFAFCLHPYVNVKELRRKRVVPLLLSNAISIETHRDNYISAGLRRYTAQNSLLWITCEEKTPTGGPFWFTSYARHNTLPIQESQCF